jgi:hypothetical protein
MAWTSRTLESAFRGSEQEHIIRGHVRWSSILKLALESAESAPYKDG